MGPVSRTPAVNCDRGGTGAAWRCLNRTLPRQSLSVALVVALQLAGAQIARAERTASVIFQVGAIAGSVSAVDPLVVGTRSPAGGSARPLSPQQTTPCAGDCNNDRSVTVDEVITMVNVALANVPIAACDNGDTDSNGLLTIDEILMAVGRTLTSCPSDGEPSLAPPSGVILSLGSTFDDLLLYWTPPKNPVDAYEVEARLDYGPYETYPELVPGDVVGIEAELDPTAPEVMLITVRMRSVLGGKRSAYSNYATLLRGPRPPIGLTAQLYLEEKVRLSWTQVSTAAEKVRIERALYNDLTHSFGPYVQVADVPAASTSFVDEGNLVVGAAYQYRIRNVANHLGQTAVSTAVERTTDQRIRILSPTDLTAAVTPEGVSLAWTNRSLLATSLVVLRAAGIGITDPVRFYPVANLATSSTAHLDTSAIPGFYTYAVAATADGSQGRSDTVSVTVSREGTAGLSLETLRMPQWTGVARDSAGRWFTAFDSNLMPPGGVGLSLSVPQGATWTRHDLPGGLIFAEPSILLDAQEHPHTVYLLPLDLTTSAPETNVVHEWFDGTAWHSETVARMVVDLPSASFALTPDGKVHILWKDWPGRTFPYYASNESGSWTVTPLDSSLYDPSYAYTAQLTATSDGTVFAVVGTSTTVVMRRQPGQAWTEELLTPGPSSFDAFVLAPSGADALGLFSLRTNGLADTEVRYRGRAADMWGAEETITSFAPPGYLPPIRAAASGSRAALLLPIPSALTLFTRADGSTWPATVLQQNTEFERNWIAFDAANHLQILTPIGPASDGFRDYALYAETE